MKPKVSVIIPAYNQEVLIKKAIFSIPCRNDIEIIVIDDNSTDNTLAVVRNIQLTTNYNLVVLYNEENMGVGFTVNRGYDVATGEYVVLLGSDDYFYTDQFLDVIENYLNGIDLVYFNLIINSGEVFRLKQETKVLYCGSTKFMRREFIGRIRCPIKRYSEDYNFFIELLKKNPTELFTDINVKHYNFPRESSLSWQAREELNKENKNG